MSIEDPSGARTPHMPLANDGRTPSRQVGWHRITVEPGYIRSDLFSRQTLEETRNFLDATIDAASEHRCSRLLICIHNSRPIFSVERYGFSRYLDIAVEAKYKIALVGLTLELRIAHQYYATLARLRGVNLRAFPEEAAAIAWLTSSGARA